MSNSQNLATIEEVLISPDIAIDKSGSPFMAIICTSPDFGRYCFETHHRNGRKLNLGLHGGWRGTIASKDVVAAFPPDDRRLAYAATRQLFHIYRPSHFVFIGSAFSLLESGRGGDLGIVGCAGQYPYPAMFQNKSANPSSDAVPCEITASSAAVRLGQTVLTNAISKEGLQNSVVAWRAGSISPWPWHPSQYEILRKRWELDVCSNSAIGFFEALQNEGITTKTADSPAILMIDQGISGAVAEEYRHRKKIFLGAALRAMVDMAAALPG
jgi:hypothetical protein